MVVDDGLPSIQAVTYAWRQVAGPGSVTFDDATRLDTQARFSHPGLYVLELIAYDSLLEAADTMEVRIDSACVAAAPSNLIAWWRADQTALDAAGANHGALDGGTTFAEQPLGQAFVFDGSNDTVRVPPSAAFDNMKSAFTVEAWIKPLSLTATQTIVAFHNGSVCTWSKVTVPESVARCPIGSQSRCTVTPLAVGGMRLSCMPGSAFSDTPGASGLKAQVAM